MDTPTRIGLGASALFTLFGFAQPSLGWAVAGPLMIICALVAVWGFWPLVEKLPVPYFKKDIPLLQAAVKAYEDTRNDPIGNSVREICQGDNDQIIMWYCYALVGHRNTGKRVRLYGTRPPSRKREAIDIDSPPGDLSIEDGVAVLRDHSQVVVGQELVVLSGDLRKAVAEIRNIGV